MIIHNFEQRTKEWYDYKVAKISGTRFGQVISTRKNRLIYELMNEKLNGYIEMQDYISEDMQYGIDNEDEALRLYTIKTGIKVNKVGAIENTNNNQHIASPDGISDCTTIIQEVKCTQNGGLHLQRIHEGVESTHLPQLINYFAICDSVKRVDFISFCDERTEKPIHIIEFYRETIIDAKKGTTVQDLVDLGLKKIPIIINDLNNKLESYNF